MAQDDRSRLWIAVEDLFILLSILALWPAAILRWGGWGWQVVMYVAVAGLIWIFVRRLGRYRQRRGPEETNKN